MRWSVYLLIVTVCTYTRRLVLYAKSVSTSVFQGWNIGTQRLLFSLLGFFRLNSLACIGLWYLIQPLAWWLSVRFGTTVRNPRGVVAPLPRASLIVQSLEQFQATVDPFALTMRVREREWHLSTQLFRLIAVCTSGQRILRRLTPLCLSHALFLCLVGVIQSFPSVFCLLCCSLRLQETLCCRVSCTSFCAHCFGVFESCSPAVTSALRSHRAKPEYISLNVFG
jgi:hypothetical protein